MAKVGQTGLNLASDYGSKGMEMANGMIKDLQLDGQDGRGDWSEQSEGLMEEFNEPLPTNDNPVTNNPKSTKELDDFQDWGVPLPKSDDKADKVESKEWEDW